MLMRAGFMAFLPFAEYSYQGRRKNAGGEVSFRGGMTHSRQVEAGWPLCDQGLMVRSGPAK